MTNAAVIGGGFGGIAAALRLRAKGYDVTVFDRCSRLGGRAQVFEKDGFKYDAGPTVITAPQVLSELFELFGKEISNYVDIVPLETWYRFSFPDGDHFDYGGSPEKIKNEIRRINPRDVSGYEALYKDSERLYRVGYEQLANQPFHRLMDMLKILPQMLRLRVYRSVWGLVSGHIQHDKLRQAFSVQPLLVGGNPFDTTCIYNLIHFLEREFGVHFTMGGTGALVDAFAKLMKEEGISVRLNETVIALPTVGKTIQSVRTDNGEEIPFDLVISNADPAHLYDKMVDAKAVSRSAKLKTKYASKSMGLFVLFFGTNMTYPDVEHHTIWLGKRYKELLSDIFDRKVLADDFSMYLHRPTATDPSFAPEGCDSFYALVPVPNMQGGIDWDDQGPRLTPRIFDALNGSILPGVKDNLAHSFFMTPSDFESRYLSPAGAGFSIAPKFTQSAWFRFHNKAEGPDNLYIVGAGSHPGAGLPGVISSAKVLDQLIPQVTAV
ncbi:phytoene desaturase family protein [Shimia sp. MIT910701]|uniref:phytoene desaturase family protein n=1 Tax=Shimia sp. MIT910701 TaxID=3096987 RepID=UPI00399B16A1